jgi:uncharacterized NAD(P)/FAD-binding protein YdhS
MKSPIYTASPTIAIVGGGVSGSLTAIQLLRLATDSLDIHLIERSGVFGRGVAYSTEEYSSLLNVPAGKMSAFPDDPKHFLRWLQARDFHDERGQAATETSFVPRNIYGRYICETLNATECEASPGVRLIRHIDVVVDIEVQADKALLYLQSGEQIRACKVVLALGNFPPRDLACFDLAVRYSPRYIKNAWSAQAFEYILPDDKVLIVGTGLTMVDVVLRLHAHGHRGSIFAVSKHGLLPQSHRLTSVTIPTLNITDLPKTARELMRYVRQQINMATITEQIDWRVIFDSLRPLISALWQRLSLNEKRRLLRHVQPYWDIHRHRMPPEAAAIIDQLRESRQLVINIGCFKHFVLNDQGIHAEIEIGEHNQFLLDVQYVINCTGPNTHYATLNDPLLNNLFKRGLAQPDCLQLGLEVENNGALRDCSGHSSIVLYTIGSALKGALWETTAVPEIRQQAVIFGELLLMALKVDKSELAESCS